MQTFSQLGIHENICASLLELGYETPSPVQAQSIPVLLKGKDLLAQAQTGTGKTAAFALPILSRIDLNKREPQALILCPTRELAIQVAEAFQRYARSLKGFHILPIYGGADYRTQLKALKAGVHVIVGTPGRIMDHYRRGSLVTENLNTVVLDEADEMLKMGFIDDVQWILDQIPCEHQTALFSATMPPIIRKISQNYLNKPANVHIQAKTQTVDAIEQTYTVVARDQKLEALTRFLTVENVDAAIIFTRTIVMSVELADRLAARGYAVAALNGDMKQVAREKVIKRIKSNSLDIVVATEVAARGIDVPRISHVINYDIPTDTESYVHRIGRTGRAGREGKALMLVTPKEAYLLKQIERDLKQRFTLLEPPSAEEINQANVKQFAADIQRVIEQQNLDHYRNIVETLAHETECSELDIAAALAFLSKKAKPVAEKLETAKFKRPSNKPSFGHKRNRSNNRTNNRSNNKPNNKRFRKSR